MTIAILSPPRTSTSGRAPVFRATIRFWIRVDSLNRPPTLLTMPSSFSSSSMPVPLPVAPHDRAQLGDGGVQVVVHHLLAILGGAVELLLGPGQPPCDGRLIL